MTTDAQVEQIPDGFDPFSADYLADPPELMQQVLRKQPVFYYPPLDAWVVSRYEDVSAVLTDYRTYRSRIYRAIPLPEQLHDRMAAEYHEVPSGIVSNIFINLDPPTHTTERRKGQQAFTRRLVKEHEQRIRAISNELIDGFAESGSCNLMRDYSQPLTMRVVSGLIGLPLDRLPQLRDWVDDFFSLMAPEQPDASADAEIHISMPSDALEQRYRSVSEAHEFFVRFLDERRANPQADLASAMALATNEDGAPAMSNEKILAHLLELTAAGSDTTANLIAYVVRKFTEEPDLLDQVKDDASLWESVVEEGLRRFAIATLFRRTNRDVELSGVHIPAESTILVNLAAANVDAEHFADPLRFDVNRENATDHVAFGKGRHFCMGAPLARLEGRVALQELYRRLPDIKADLDEPLEFSPAITVRSLKRLTVRW